MGYRRLRLSPPIWINLLDSIFFGSFPFSRQGENDSWKFLPFHRESLSPRCEGNYRRKNERNYSINLFESIFGLVRHCIFVVLFRHSRLPFNGGDKIAFQNWSYFEGSNHSLSFEASRLLGDWSLGVYTVARPSAHFAISLSISVDL